VLIIKINNKIKKVRINFPLFPPSLSPSPFGEGRGEQGKGKSNIFFLFSLSTSSSLVVVIDDGLRMLWSR
jgi:hypothetical protein